MSFILQYLKLFQKSFSFLSYSWTCHLWRLILPRVAVVDFRQVVSKMASNTSKIRYLSRKWTWTPTSMVIHSASNLKYLQQKKKNALQFVPIQYFLFGTLLLVVHKILWTRVTNATDMVLSFWWFLAFYSQLEIFLQFGIVNKKLQTSRRRCGIFLYVLSFVLFPKKISSMHRIAEVMYLLILYFLSWLANAPYS